jgi:hypothetical protein
MGNTTKFGAECITWDKRQVNDGTLCKQESPRQGPSGFSAIVDEWAASANDWFTRAGETLSGHSKSIVLSLVDLLPMKQASPFSTALLKHYVERSGEPYRLDGIPKEWEDWIIKATGSRVGKHRGLDPYNSGLYDLRNSLGHFDVTVKIYTDATKTYEISDKYEFGYFANDKSQKGRHGFPLGVMSEWKLESARRMLPQTEYFNPGGFKEKWEIRTLGKETILFIPHQFLMEQGKAFSVTGSFIR